MMRFHPAAELFPLLDGAEFDELVADIRRHGLREPIVLCEGVILDGRNRLRACEAAGVEPRFETYAGDDPIAYVVSLNLKRRHLSESQRAMVAAKIATMRQGERTDLAAIAAMSQPDAALLLNVSRGSVQRAAQVVKEGTPELVAAVEQGRVSVSAAADVASLPRAEQAGIIARGEREILEAARAIRGERAKANAAARAALAAQPVELPAGKYRVIVIDPPWPMEKIARDVRPNQVGFDYPTMDEDRLAAFPVADMAAEDCHLFCWTTQRFLPASLRLLERWGFRYVCAFVWHKPGGFQPIGLPQYNCEFAVYARRGTPAFADTTQFPCCFEAPRREHSRKPDEFYDTVKRVTGGPRIDVFSREPRAGFNQFGNEADKFAGATL